MVALVPMTENEFEMFLQYLTQDYAQDHVKAGRWSEEEAMQEAQQEIQRYLPQGLHTPEHYLFMLRDEQREANVGVLWFALQKRGGEQQAFIYDIEVFEEFRRRGYATQAFLLLETRVREPGASSIGLHVFGHNLAAREMYEKLGYATTNVQMVKQLVIK
jgi:RimJ/RimL family protein N-acetyltransferase